MAKAADCKSAIVGSTPTDASNFKGFPELSGNPFFVDAGMALAIRVHQKKETQRRKDAEFMRQQFNLFATLRLRVSAFNSFLERASRL